MVVERALQIVGKLNGVLDVQKLSDDNKKTLMKLESERKEDLIPVVNEGLKEGLQRDFSIVLFKNSHFRLPPVPTVLLVTDGGEVLGQEVLTMEDKLKFEDQADSIFISPDFVIFKPRRNGFINREPQKQFFLLPPVPFPELDGLDGITDVVSCSPSTNGDSYLKKEYGHPDDPKIATIIVGFRDGSLINNTKNP
jgi:hypothetical protein